MIIIFLFTLFKNFFDHFMNIHIRSFLRETLVKLGGENCTFT